MSATPKLGLKLTSESDTTKTFKTFRLELSGDSEESNMMIIDTAVGELMARLDSLEDTPITWGMLKNGFKSESSS